MGGGHNKIWNFSQSLGGGEVQIWGSVKNAKIIGFWIFCKTFYIKGRELWVKNV